MGPLFELFQAYGGAEVVRDVARETGHWWEYSLMALAGLSEGEGIPVLIAEAYNPTVPLEHKSQFPVRCGGVCPKLSVSTAARGPRGSPRRSMAELAART